MNDKEFNQAQQYKLEIKARLEPLLSICKQIKDIGNLDKGKLQDAYSSYFKPNNLYWSNIKKELINLFSLYLRYKNCK